MKNVFEFTTTISTRDGGCTTSYSPENLLLWNKDGIDAKICQFQNDIQKFIDKENESDIEITFHVKKRKMTFESDLLKD